MANRGSPARARVVKVGTSSVTRDNGELDEDALAKLCADIATARAVGYPIVMVLSGAVPRGCPALGSFRTPRRYRNAAGDRRGGSAPGCSRRSRRCSNRTRSSRGRCCSRRTTSSSAARTSMPGKPCIGCSNFVVPGRQRERRHRRRRDPLRRQRSAPALVSHLLGAHCCCSRYRRVVLPRPGIDPAASLIEEIVEVDAALEAVAGASRSTAGSGGMASKLAAGKIAAWSGVRAVIASAAVDNVVLDALEGRAVGTVIQPRRSGWRAASCGSRSRGAAGRIVVDAGARAALTHGGRSLCRGVRSVEGEFDVDDAVEVAGPDGRPFAKGPPAAAPRLRRSSDARRPTFLTAPNVVIHRDDLAVLPRRTPSSLLGCAEQCSASERVFRRHTTVNSHLRGPHDRWVLTAPSRI